MNHELMSHANEAQDRRIDKLTDAIEKLITIVQSDESRISRLE